MTTSKGGPWSHIRQPNLLKRGGPASEAPAGLLPPVAAASVSVRQKIRRRAHIWQTTQQELVLLTVEVVKWNGATTRLFIVGEISCILENTPTGCRCFAVYLRKKLANILYEKIGLLECREVTASWHLSDLYNVISLLDPAERTGENFLRKIGKRDGSVQMW